jgi:uridine kinase
MWENNWMISEDIYVEEQKLYKRADLVVDGTK